MTSEAQRNANRANARKSTGPRTAAGKLISSQNARIHGFAGRVAVLPDDEALLYIELCERYIHELQPATLVEEELVKTIADSNWQLNRLRAIEEQITRALFEIHISRPGTTPDQASAHAHRADLGQPGSLDHIVRYRAHFQRALMQALKELDRRQSARRAEETSGDETSPDPISPQPHAAQPNGHPSPIGEPIGFDLQNEDFANLLSTVRQIIFDRQTPDEPPIDLGPLASAA